MAGPDGSARLQRRIVEIDSLDEFDAVAGASRAATMDGWRVRRVDLTVQEVFQDACENYYASTDLVAPMVLVGTHHWTETVPAWPLLSALATTRGFANAVALVDDVAAAARFLAR